MTLTFADMIANEADDVFVNANEFAETFTLSRGMRDGASVAAIMAMRQVTLSDVEGLLSILHYVDFTLPVTGYLVRGVVVEPRSGDRFSKSGKIWEVADIAGAGCWEFTGGGSALMRVHAKQVT